MAESRSGGNEKVKLLCLESPLRNIEDNNVLGDLFKLEQILRLIRRRMSSRSSSVLLLRTRLQTGLSEE